MLPQTILPFKLEKSDEKLTARAGLALVAESADGYGLKRDFERELLHPGAIKAPQVVDFLRHLRRHLPGKLLIVWDGLPAHRSLLVRRYVESLNGKIQIERLPAYAPELNPVEYLWGYWKRRELAHFCPKDFGVLSVHARRRIQSIQRRPRLLRAFWQQAELV